ncbi:hypothetical protein NVP2275O_372 [Vibrio phage 2.275.O._10N.286.54.E11]|nr:hypothetical protein NVP2275O_372 [Vibrio phage 2.275.O._10N.286.54.E11]
MIYLYYIHREHITDLSKGHIGITNNPENARGIINDSLHNNHLKNALNKYIDITFTILDSGNDESVPL